MRDLRRYRERRDPDRTPEPFGAERAMRVLPPSSARIFTVQQHAARALHHDLRLEIDDVLVSWAVPRGPSLDPADKRLAVQTEDHPLEYADFEGVIPAGNYGAGAMIVWDRGWWRPADGVPPARGLEAGKLDLELHGHKLTGRFALVRTRGGGGRDWLLIRKGAPPDPPLDPVADQPESVLSGLRVEEVREGASRAEEVRVALRGRRAPRAELGPDDLRPMLAATGEGPFSREGWIFELKHDGVRVLAVRDGERARLVARSGRDCSALYPEVVLAVRHLPLDRFVLDGEVVALDETGRSSFERLQRRFTQSDPAAIARARVELPVRLEAFDLLAADGRDLRGLPLVERKRVLALFAPRRGFVRFADHVAGDGVALHEAARAHGLEGTVAKRADSRYESGRRSRRWLKLKVPRSACLAVAGIASGRGHRSAMGSLMLAGRRDGDWVYAGNVGSGLDERSIAEILARAAGSEVDAPVYANAPQPPVRGARHLRPELVCEVRFTEVTSAGLLRHPVFVRLRDDVAPEACEAPSPRGEPPPTAVTATPEPEPALTRLDKVFWPVEGYTKGDLLAWYEGVWPWLAPYLADRPVVLTRYPDGIEGKSFYQKNAPEFTPDWVRRARIDDTDYFVCNDLRTLMYVVNSGAIPLHVWSARLGSIERPDWLILDLDPKDAPFAHVVEVARHLHRLLDEAGVPHFAKTSGQDGLHVLLPLSGRLDHEEARALAEAVARTVARELPEIATVTRPRAARRGRVYVDFLQNGRGKLIAAPFSVRPRAGAPVSAPLRWSQVTRRLDPARFTIRTLLPRLRRSGDPLRGVLDEGIDVDRLLEALAARAEADLA